mgnify:CR=1 FL=1
MLFRSSRGEIDAYTEFVKIYGAKGLAWIKVNEVAKGRDGLQSPIVKNLHDAAIAEILKRTEARDGDIIFFGADKGEEEVEWRTQKYKIDVPFGRSLNREKALSGEPMLIWALNGQPLTKHQGAPLRLLVPGWYGVCNVKWLSQIHIQEDAYLGKYQARWYRTVRGEMIDGEMKYMETAVTHMNIKSFIARVLKSGTQYKVQGIVLNDGTPLKSVEVKVDDGPWQPAVLDASMAKEKYGWKYFSFAWNNATPGAHTLVSRATDVNGRVQPTAEELKEKKSFLEENSQVPRKVMVA